MEFIDRQTGRTAWTTVHKVGSDVSLIIGLYGNGDPSVQLSFNDIKALRKQVAGVAGVSGGRFKRMARFRSTSADPGDELFLICEITPGGLRLEVESTWGSEVEVLLEHGVAARIADLLAAAIDAQDAECAT